MFSSARYALCIVRSTPSQDERLRVRLQEAVDKIAGGSADKFGQAIGYANGGYIRECLSRKKPVREKLIERVHAHPELVGWFSGQLSAVAAGDLQDAESRALLSAFEALPHHARREALAFIKGMAAGAGLAAAPEPRESGELPAQQASHDQPRRAA